MHDWFTSFLMRRPFFGYLPAAASTSVGAWAIIENVTKITGLISVVIGLIVGVYTLRIQKRTWEDGRKK